MIAPHFPPPPHARVPANASFDTILAAALEGLQQGLDRALLFPRWTAFALIGFAAALMLLGRHGQRLLAGTFLGSLVVLFALLFLRQQAPDAAWPGLVAVIGGGGAFALGLGVPGWTTSLASALTLGALGSFFAYQAGLPWLAGALPFALLGLFLGLADHLWWGLWMPPFAAALSLTVAAARLLAPHSEGSHVPQLLSISWALAVLGALTIALVAISLERDHLRRKRLAGKSKSVKDDELKKKLTKDRERHDKYLGVTKKN